ncbi:hypothetical protein [Microcoleus sp. EPA2]|uniref:hypothetical protein n=1 Tax=Microcoleus sp. EPA2 TaxID=2841654 RepID=UPI00312B99FB
MKIEPIKENFKKILMVSSIALASKIRIRFHSRHGSVMQRGEVLGIESKFGSIEIRNFEVILGTYLVRQIRAVIGLSRRLTTFFPTWHCLQY